MPYCYRMIDIAVNKKKNRSDLTVAPLTAERGGGNTILVWSALATWTSCTEIFNMLLLLESKFVKLTERSFVKSKGRMEHQQQGSKYTLGLESKIYRTSSSTISSTNMSTTSTAPITRATAASSRAWVQDFWQSLVWSGKKYSMTCFWHAKLKICQTWWRLVRMGSSTF